MTRQYVEGGVNPNDTNDLAFERAAKKELAKQDNEHRRYLLELRRLQRATGAKYALAIHAAWEAGNENAYDAPAPE